MSDAQLDAIFKALGHPVRRAILDRLVEAPGANVLELAGCFTMSRIAVMKHLRMLEAARLVISRKEGRQRLHFLNAVPLQQIADRWTDRYSRFWAGRMVDLKQRIEARTQSSAAEGAPPRKAADSA